MKENKFHLIGIGGIGMSALARLLMAKQHQVSGSDRATQGEVVKLKEEGAHIFQGHQSENIEVPETTVVYSTAIKEDNPEIVKAKSLNCTLWHRSDLLSYLMSSTESLAVAGTHGKTTTSALLSHVLISSGKSPTYVVGGILTNRRTNSERGEGKYFVLEADESDGSLLKYHPEGSILTNIEADHLDYYYRDLDHIKECFEQYISQVKCPEYFFWCMDCPHLQKMNPKGFSYGFHEKSDLKILSYKQQEWSSIFTLEFQGKKYEGIELSMIGEQNVLNAAAVFGLCLQLGLSQEEIRLAFCSFQGIKRRGEKLGKVSKIDFIDDYAHHPTEVEYVLKGLRKACPQRRIIALFQPHRYSRVKYFQEDFARSFKKCSEVWLTDVFSAGEPPLENFSEKEYAKTIEELSDVPTTYVPRNQVLEFLLKEVRPHDVVITLGAGDVTHIGREAVERLKDNPPKLQVGLVCGSTSVEHDVSLISRDYFVKNLDPNLYDVSLFKIDLDGKWQLEGEGEVQEETLSPEVLKKLQSCDLFFPVVHGPRGEDGMLQGFFQTLNKPYAGSGYSSCALAMNKVWTKALVEKAGIKTAPYLSFHKKEWTSSHKDIKKVEKTLNYPLVVKPASLGSSIEVSFVQNSEELLKAAQGVFSYDEHVLIEEQIIGREIEVSILEDEHLICPRPGEIITAKFKHSYSAKYGSDPIEKVVEAPLSESEIEKCQVIAKRVYREIEARGFIRIDLFLKANGDIIFNEANPIPGCAPKSLFPKMLELKYTSGFEILDQMVINAFYHYRLDQRHRRVSKRFVHALRDAAQ